jgi:hypothetical protein
VSTEIKPLIDPAVIAATVRTIQQYGQEVLRPAGAAMAAAITAGFEAVHHAMQATATEPALRRNPQ